MTDITFGEETITTFRQALERVSALAHAKLPAELHGNLERAHALVLHRCPHCEGNTTPPVRSQWRAMAAPQAPGEAPGPDDREPPTPGVPAERPCGRDPREETTMPYAYRDLPPGHDAGGLRVRTDACPRCDTYLWQDATGLWCPGCAWCAACDGQGCPQCRDDAR